MPVELKEVVEFLGYKADEIKELSDLKEKFDTDFVRAANINEDLEPVKKLIGKHIFGIENHLRKYAKEIEVDLDFNSEPVKKLGLTDKFKLVIEGVDKKNKSTIDELTIKAGQGNDEKVKEWETKYEKLKNKFSDTEGLLKTTTNEFNGYKEKSAGELKNVTLNVLKSDALSKVKFKPDINDIEKEGYASIINKNYKFDLDENQKLLVTDKEGKQIPNPKVTGTFKTINEILEEEAIKGGLYKLNADGGKVKPANVVIQQQNSGTSQRPLARRLGQ